MLLSTYGCQQIGGEKGVIPPTLQRLTHGGQDLFPGPPRVIQRNGAAENSFNRRQHGSPRFAGIVDEVRYRVGQLECHIRMVGGADAEVCYVSVFMVARVIDVRKGGGGVRPEWLRC